MLTKFSDTGDIPKVAWILDEKPRYNAQSSGSMFSGWVMENSWIQKWENHSCVPGGLIWCQRVGRTRRQEGQSHRPVGKACEGWHFLIIYTQFYKYSITAILTWGSMKPKDRSVPDWYVKPGRWVTLAWQHCSSQGSCVTFLSLFLYWLDKRWGLRFNHRNWSSALWIEQ